MKSKDYFEYDFKASVVVFLVALPLCLGIALASGAPLFAGLTAGIVGGIVAGFLSGSPLSVSGPAAGLTTIVALAIMKLASYEAFLLSVVIAGMMQIVLGDRSFFPCLRSQRNACCYRSHTHSQTSTSRLRL